MGNLPVTSSDAAAPRQEPASRAYPALDRPIRLGASTGTAVVFGMVFLAAILVRFFHLDTYALTQREAAWAYGAFSLYLNKPMPGAPVVSDVAPLFQMLEAFSYFLFGVTDATARVMPAVFGLGLVVLLTMVRDVVPRSVTLAMVILAGLSPTLVFASRTVSPVIEIGFFSLLIIVAVVRIGAAEPGPRAGIWSAILGVAIAATYASGIEGFSALIAVAIAIGVGVATEPREAPAGALRRGMAALTGSPMNLPLLGASLVAALLFFFTRFFSDVGSIDGIFTTISNWGRMMGSQSSPIPTSIFFWASLLYEFLAVAFAIVAIVVPRRTMPEGSASLYPAPFAAWTVSALVLCSLAQGRDADQAALVALPLAITGAYGLGYTIERIPWGRMLATPSGLAPLSVAGIVVGLVAAFVIVARSNDPGRTGTGASMVLQLAFVLILIVAPLAYILVTEFSKTDSRQYVGWSALFVLAILLGLLTIRTTTSLSFYRADEGTELLAPRTPTTGVLPIVEQTKRLSRDVSITTMNATDNTGSYGITIAIDPDAKWPWAWYFRDFPYATITVPAGWNDADLVISTSTEGMAEAGYVVQTRNAQNRIAPVYEDLDATTILRHMVNPGEWYDGMRYVLFREFEGSSAPGQISFGYSYELGNKLNPNFGPFNLDDDVGPGAGLGQLNSPMGVTLSEDGDTIYVLDSGNLRVQRYDRDGTFIGVWDGTTDANAAFATQFGQGPGGILESESGVTYVADTWNHRIVALTPEGEFATEIGQRGVPTDIQNSPDPTLSPGLFYGPRGIAIHEGLIYVTDTGNERVQVFQTDGTPVLQFGGYGTEPGKLIEPVGIAIGPDGLVYVADSGNGRIAVFTTAGEFVENYTIDSWANQAERLNYLAFGPDGVLYATTPSTGEVLAFGNGQYAVIAGPDSPEEFSRPTGITVDDSNALLVTDAGRASVVEFEPDVPSELVPEGMGTPVASPEADEIPATPIG